MRTVNEITDPAQLLDFAQSKRLLQFSSGQALGDTTALLTRPNEERGSDEMGMIEAAHKRMGKLIDLHNAMPEVVRRLNDGATKLDVMREIKVGIMRERLTLTDYDTVSRMARREKLISFRNRQKDPANNYELRADNHQRVRAVADRLGITPQRALNKILDDF